MRSKQCLSVCLSILFAIPTWARQIPTPQSIQRDPQAITILSQILSAAGGMQALSAVHDVSATGTVSYNWGDTPVQGNVTVKGRGVAQFRVDASLPDGNRTWGISNGQRFQKDPDGTVTVAPYQDPSSFQNILFPWAHLFIAVQDLS